MLDFLIIFKLKVKIKEDYNFTRVEQSTFFAVKSNVVRNKKYLFFLSETRKRLSKLSLKEIRTYLYVITNDVSKQNLSFSNF